MGNPSQYLPEYYVVVPSWENLHYKLNCSLIFSVSYSVMYSDANDVCGVTLSYIDTKQAESMPDYGGNRTYDLWNASPMSCELSYLPVDLKTRKTTGTSCQIEIHFSVQVIKLLMKYNLL